MVVPWLSDITQHTRVKAPSPSKTLDHLCFWLKKHKIALYVVVKVNKHVNFRLLSLLLKKRLTAFVCGWKSTRKRSTCGFKRTRGLSVFLDVKALCHPCLWLKKHKKTTFVCGWKSTWSPLFMYLKGPWSWKGTTRPPVFVVVPWLSDWPRRRADFASCLPSIYTNLL